MRKWLFLLCLLLFADAWLLGELEERTSLDTLREAGIPEESFQKAGNQQRRISSLHRILERSGIFSSGLSL